MKTILLVDVHQWSQTRLPYYFLVKGLQKRMKSEVVGFKSDSLSFTPPFMLPWRVRAIKRRIGAETWKFYRGQLGMRRLVLPVVSAKAGRKRKDSGQFSRIEVPGSPEELESFEWKGVLIGDLIYDAFCKHHRLPTPDLSSEKFNRFFWDSLRLTDFWVEFFRENRVSALIGDSVYLQGIPLRISSYLEIPTFTANLGGIDRLHNLNPREDSLFLHYPEWARLIPPSTLAKGKREAGKTLKLLLSGAKIPRKNLYDGPSAFSQKDAVPHWEDDGREGAVIVPHDFFDSSHLRGNHLYPDFLLWLWRLGELSKEVDMNWWIKPHPRESEETLSILRDFQKDFPHIRSLPATVNPRDFKYIRARVALTVKGTIAGEYPLLGISVVNASLANFHVRYKFSESPADREAYEQMILGLPHSLKLRDSEEIEEFFFLRHILEYQGTFLTPDEVSGRVWSGDQAWKDLIGHYDGIRTRKLFDLVDDYLQSNATWLRGMHILGISENGGLWLK